MFKITLSLWDTGGQERFNFFKTNFFRGVAAVGLVFDISRPNTFDMIDEEGFVLARAKFDDVYTMPKDKAKLHAKSPGVNFSQGKYDVILTFDLDGGILVKEYRIDVSGSGRIVNIKEIE